MHAIQRATIVLLMGAAYLGGCAVAGDGVEYGSSESDSWEVFRDGTYREPWEDGHYIVNGDIAIKDEKALYEFWADLQQGALAVNRRGGADDKWNDSAKLDLTYCISDSFGARKQTMVAAMNQAVAGWHSRGNVKFVHLTAHDASCTASNTAVVFDVRPVSGQPYLARAFFPSSGRVSRNILVDTSSFGNTGWSLASVIGHELGHALGFRHEHTRPEAGKCFEDNNWRALTPYDSASIMHYPQCNGSTSSLNWSARDGQGMAAIYGAPGTTPTPPPPPPADSDSHTGSVGNKQMIQLGSYPVAAGELFKVTMTGTGDPDLYVRWNSAPTTTAFHCRPYIDGPDEECHLSVPSGATRAHVAVRGYRPGTYDVTVTW